IENARLFEELERRNRELREALEQQTATSEILRVIASSPTDAQRVLDTIADTASHLCSPTLATIRLVEGENYYVAASTDPDLLGASVGVGRPISGRAPSGEAIRERRAVHTVDVTAPESLARY